MKPQFELTQQERVDLRWGNLIAVYQKIDRILSGYRDITTKAVSHSAPAPAWTSLSTGEICFATHILGNPVTREDVAAITAVNYH